MRGDGPVRIVVSGYHGMGNTGDEAVLEAFLQGVRKVLPQARLTVLSGIRKAPSGRTVWTP